MANYLYNGIELPEIPFVATETYPYIVIVSKDNANRPYTVYACKTVPKIINGGKLEAGTTLSRGKYYHYNSHMMAWEYTRKDAPISITGVPIWSNTDIIYKTNYSDDASLAGTLFLSASEPVLVEGSDESEDNKEIVETDFMLFNGVKLPKLPEWDKSTYSYALIGGPYTSEGYPDAYYYSFAAVNLPLEFRTGDGYAFVSSNSLKWQASMLATTQELAEYLTTSENVLGSARTNAWAELENVTMLGLSANEPILWANYYILNSDGSVFLAASDPIPVTTAAPIDPTSFYLLSGLLFAQKARLSLVYKQLSLNSLCDINNILLKSLDDFFLIPNEKEE